jgi:hypothetical protein
MTKKDFVLQHFLNTMTCDGGPVMVTGQEKLFKLSERVGELLDQQYHAFDEEPADNVD